MELVKETPLSVAYRTWLARPPRPSLSIVVKASFELAAGTLALADEQPFPEGERWIDDDVERPLATPGDLAPFKRRGECFVLGACHPPGGEATRSQVAFSIGAVQKNIAVYGDRTFERGLDRPAPFTSMPLTWERAFGGPGHPQNPAGVALPNLEDPQHTIQGRGGAATPTCTTPIAPSWPERARRAGTYGRAYLRTHYPGLAEDIDWEHFNAAPADQRIEGYWRGDEEIVLVNLLLGEPSVRARLPGLRPRAFLTPSGSPDPLAQLWEVPLRLDTIVVDGEARAVRCVWRGVLDVGSAALTEMAALCVLHDEPRETRSLDACRAVFREAEARRREEEASLAATPPPLRGERAAADLDANAPLFKTLMGAELKWAHLDQAMTVEAAGSNLMAELAALMKQKGVTLDPGHPLQRLLDQTPSDRGAPRALDEDELRAIEARVLAEEQARRGDDRVLRERVQRALLAGESCAGWDLSGVDLSRLRLSGGDFRGARFVRAVLAGTIFGDTDFSGATFEESELSDAQFEGARFDAATFHFCRIERAHFGDATLDDASFTECLLRGARFSRTFGRRAELMSSRLEDATFDDSVFDGADFSGSVLDGALLGRTSLIDAWWIDGVSAKAARLDRCDVTKLRATDGAELTGATFAACVATRARFVGARAQRADFSFSELAGASFAGADLEGAKLMACGLRKARFDDASLRGASLIKSDLYAARLERADARGADLRGASLHAAELLDANLSAAKLELSDTSATRVSP